jgi:hypothetical protein
MSSKGDRMGAIIYAISGVWQRMAKKDKSEWRSLISLLLKTERHEFDSQQGKYFGSL